MMTILGLAMLSSLATSKPTRCELAYVHRCKQIVEEAGRAPNRHAGQEVAERNSADAKASDWRAAEDGCRAELSACEKACPARTEKCADGMKASLKIVEERGRSEREPAATGEESPTFERALDVRKRTLSVPALPDANED